MNEFSRWHRINLLMLKYSLGKNNRVSSKMYIQGLQKAPFLAYNRFGTAVFLNFSIFLIILVEQIFMVTPNVPRRLPLKLGNTLHALPVQKSR